MKTPLVDRMLKKGAPKAWSIEVELLQAKIDYLTATKEEYAGIIDILARRVEKLELVARAAEEFYTNLLSPEAQFELEEALEAYRNT